MFISSNGLTQADLESAIVLNPLIVSPDTSVMMAIAQMSGVRTVCPSSRETDSEIEALHLEVRSSCVLVVEANKLLGIFTERDVVRLSSQKRSLENLCIADVMTHPVITLRQSAFTDFFFAINLLQQYHIRHLPILDEQDNIIGLVNHESLQQLSRPIDLLRLRLVADVMTPQVITAAPSVSMLTIAQLMTEYRVSSVVIVEERSPKTHNQVLQLPIGIVTERDIVQFHALELDFERLQAETVMSTPVFSVSPQESLWSVQQVMQQYLVKRIVVTGKQGELLGIVTQTSILKVLNPLELSHLVDVLENRVSCLEAEKLELLQNRNNELEQQVQERTAILKAKAEREQLITNVATQIRSSLNLQDILDRTVKEVRSLLNCDRAAIWQLQPDWSIVAVAESVANGCVSYKDKKVQDMCFAPDLADVYRNERIRVVSDIYKAPMSDCHRQLLANLDIRAKILVPIIHNSNLWGLLNVVESREPREWQAEEAMLLRQLATQLAIAIQQATAYEQLQTELTERQRTEANLRQSEQRYASLAAAAPVGIFRTDAQGNCVYVNERWCKIAGLNLEEAQGSGWVKALHPDDRQKVAAEWYSAAQENRPFQLEYRFQQSDKTIAWVFGQAVAEYNPAGQITGYIGTITDISDRKQAEEQLLYNALHDTLTGLPNRNFLMERLELAIQRAKRRENYHFAVLFLDMDRFKLINDSLGHLAGDELLTLIAQKLKSKIRATDLAARLGGDEFVVLLEDLRGIEEAVYVAERLIQEFQVPITLNGYEFFLTTSIGIVFAQDNYHQASDLLRDSDIAMYRAKAQGKSCYKIFDAQMHNQALIRLNLENDLRKALEREEFIAYYQPIVDINTQNLIGFEALVRWQHPTRGFVSPIEFVSIAEETGLIVPLDRWMLYTACQQLATWKTQFSSQLPLKVSVNMSVQDLRKANLIKDVETILAQTGLDGQCLTLEITESMLIDNIMETIKVLEQLKRLGIQISIDDFGTGYSSLNYLHRLPADTLKIDRCFIQQMQEGNRNYQVVKTIITLSNQLGLGVVAEGIETQQQLQSLQHLGCEFGQGYLFSKPLANRDIETLLMGMGHGA
ncbi:EAL domain-containing protein [Tolypothrix sp. PCC 7910]|uniref:EAL domain-containing protein n=1 Tax=Tolypothrix sp. PCC 7910 TaxID=2099387 RepID=UPI0014278FB4|nr:EAL domain-containing protein [Tolypothrix sp. PCC 7910]QIR35436.1 EAL domain-containing protein [Tolypothrix sp. PCC 7910]QPZ75128.1 GAF domain protein TPL0500 [Tolypothrix sp. PCC 7910]